MTKIRKRTSELPLYVIDYDQLRELRYIERRLLENDKYLTPEKRRYIANLLSSMINEIANQQLTIGKLKGGNNERPV
jgi:hypothetical protein